MKHYHLKGDWYLLMKGHWHHALPSCPALFSALSVIALALQVDDAAGTDSLMTAVVIIAAQTLRLHV
jgi:hypothetical protein